MGATSEMRQPEDPAQMLLPKVSHFGGLPVKG